MDNFIILAVLAVIIGAALAYVIKAKKRGVKCIGCPDGEKCSGNCGCCNGCSASQDNCS